MLGIRNEFDRLRAVLVNSGGALVPKEEAARHHQRYGARIDEEEHFHPEAAPWDPSRVREQHACLLSELERKGVEVIRTEDVEGGIYALFTRDVGFVVGDTFFHARLGDGVRRTERAGLRIVEKRFPSQVELTRGTVEGGDVFVHDSTVFVGITAFSTDRAGFEGLRAQLEPRGYECIPIRLAENVLHLDCRFAILGPELALLHREDLHPEDARLIERRFRVLPIETQELKTLAPNVLCLSQRELVLDQRNQRLADALAREGIEPVLIEYSEVTKLWGAFRCATLPLRREEDPRQADTSAPARASARGSR